MHDKIRVRFLMQDRGQLYGAERAVLDLLRGLQDVERLEVSVCLIEESRIGGAPSVFLAALEAIGLDCQRYLVSGRISWGLVTFLREWSGTVDIIHTVGPKATVYAAVARPKGCRLVSTLHGWLFRKSAKERFYEWLELCAFRRFDRIIVLSRFYAKLLQRKGIDEGRLVIIPSAWQGPVADAPNARRDSDADVLRVGMLGRFSSEKNHGMLLDAVARLRKSDRPLHCILAGEGALRSKLEAEVKAKKDLANTVEFWPYTSPDAFFSAVDVLVVCSWIENQPYSIMEAMARGVPIVATRVGGIPEMLAKDCGLLVDLDDEQALADALLQLSKDPDLRCRIATAARKRIGSAYSGDKMIGDHLQLYRGVFND